MSALPALAAALIVLRLVGELALGALNRAEVRRHAGRPPPAAAAVMDAAAFARSGDYTLAKSRFSSVASAFDAAVLAAALFSGVLPWLYARVAAWGPPGVAWTGALFLVLAGMLVAAPGLPLDWWEHFRLEARFGFNQSTPRLWALDKLKGGAVAAAIGFPLLWALLLVVRAAGAWWWAWGFALLFAFQLAALVLYPRLILPLFNRLSPLPEGELRARLLGLGERTGFRAQSIQVIDGSRRSGHSNAYFTGFGRFRRIVLFDTLVAQLAPAELEAVLAHEIGHYRCGHVPKRIALSAVLLLAGFALVAWLAAQPGFNAAFGLPPGAMAPSLLLFALCSGLVGFWFSPLSSLLSRRHEFEADAFARRAMGGPGPLVAALRRLAEKNLSNLTPHPWFAAFYYSHPTIAERERALQIQ
ncbi:MAG TPA: M48 family metallopeptidase [Opitutaceae bacterium]|nr:M48 family metallopeptidase [Opitutaceae bacterium]